MLYNSPRKHVDAGCKVSSIARWNGWVDNLRRVINRCTKAEHILNVDAIHMVAHNAIVAYLRWVCTQVADRNEVICLTLRADLGWLSVHQCLESFLGYSRE